MSDALTQLRTALAPKGLMQRIPFPTESYQHTSVPLSAKHLINLYAEQEPTDARTQVALLSTPALGLIQTVGSGPILALNSDEPGRLYIVSGQHFWRISIPGPTEDLGAVGGASFDTNGADTLMPTIAAGPTAVVVCVPPNAYTADHLGALNQIGGDFPGARSVAYIDGYFVFTSANDTSQFFSSHLLDPANYDGLDFAYADGVPNVLSRVITHRNELWFFGPGGVEVWYDAGAADFPFRRRAVIPVPGPTSAKSIATGDGSTWWLGTDNIAYRSNGYQAARVSTHAIEAILQADPTSVTGGMFYSQGGHSFYIFSMTGRTLAYDCATKQWADRSSSWDGQARWRAQSVATVALNPPLFGDSRSGQLYFPIASVNDAEAVPVRRMTMPPLWGGTNRAFCSRLEIEMEVGSGDVLGNNVILEWSDDGGVTFTGGPRVMSVGARGERGVRVYTTRLGSFRQRVFRITTSGIVTYYAVDAAITPGAN